MTDQEVFDKLKQGDKTAMEWLYRNKRDHFIGYFIKHHKLSVHEATDLAIDALVALGASAERNKERSLTAQITSLWIKIGRNMHLDEKRKNLKLPISNWDDFTEYIKNTEGGENPFDADDFEDILPFVEPLVHTMKEPCQTILTAYYWENKTDRSISELLKDNENIKKDMSEAAVKMKRLRCVEALRQLIFNQLKDN